MGKVWGEILESSDLTGSLRVFHAEIFPEKKVILAARARFVFYNDPTFSTLTMDIYSDQNDQPKQVIAQSQTVYTKAQLLTESNAVLEIPFTFDYIPMQSGVKYHFVPRGTGYTATSSSHIAWCKGWPVKANGADLDANKLGVAPYQIFFIGADL